MTSIAQCIPICFIFVFFSLFLPFIKLAKSTDNGQFLNHIKCECKYDARIDDLPIYTWNGADGHFLLVNIGFKEKYSPYSFFYASH